MKKIFFAAVFLATNFFANFVSASDDALISVFSEDVKFAESVLPYDSGIFVSNFGSDELEPRKDENKGYIFYRKDGINKKIVEGLHKPTAMKVKDNFLFVCDETVLKIFDLKNLSAKPKIISFAPEDKVVNALALDENNYLYISITDSGKIYKLDVSDVKNLKNPELWLKISGPNGLNIGEGVMYIATIPPDYKTVTSEFVIYCVKDLKKPVAEKFIDIPGLYDGVALSKDFKTLYATNWATGSLTAIDIKTKKFRTIYAEKGIGPCDIAYSEGKIILPEIIGSKIISINVEKF